MTRKLRILFVDDEPNVLRGLRRAMYEMEPQWDMFFAPSGADALALMETTPMDVVVSDMRMPQMDGAHLLDIVRQCHPQTIRIILSGYAEADSVLKTVAPAHVYLAKPCSAERLLNAISRPLTLRIFLNEPALLAAIGGLSSLPSLPADYSRIMEELQRPQASAASIAQILSHDIAMTAEILKLTNSAFFSVQSQVTNLLQAVKILGVDTVQTLVLHLGIFRQMDHLRDQHGVLEQLTQHSLRLANLAAAFAEDLGGSEIMIGSSRFAAMLSAVGMVVLLDRDSERYQNTLSLTASGASLFDAEQQVYHTNSAYVGGYLLGLWGFSDAIVEAVTFASCPRSAPSPHNPILLATHLAWAMGPPLPILPATAVQPDLLDMTYLVDLRQDSRIAYWRDKAAQWMAGDV